MTRINLTVLWVTIALLSTHSSSVPLPGSGSSRAAVPGKIVEKWRPRIFGHRGVVMSKFKVNERRGKIAPENTLISFAHALIEGDSLEMDAGIAPEVVVVVENGMREPAKGTNYKLVMGHDHHNNPGLWTFPDDLKTNLDNIALFHTTFRELRTAQPAHEYQSGFDGNFRHKGITRPTLNEVFSFLRCVEKSTANAPKGGNKAQIPKIVVNVEAKVNPNAGQPDPSATSKNYPIETAKREKFVEMMWPIFKKEAEDGRRIIFQCFDLKTLKLFEAKATSNPQTTGPRIRLSFLADANHNPENQRSVWTDDADIEAVKPPGSMPVTWARKLAAHVSPNVQVFSSSVPFFRDLFQGHEKLEENEKMGLTYVPWTVVADNPKLGLDLLGEGAESFILNERYKVEGVQEFPRGHRYDKGVIQGCLDKHNPAPQAWRGPIIQGTSKKQE